MTINKSMYDKFKRERDAKNKFFISSFKFVILAALIYAAYLFAMGDYDALLKKITGN